MANEANDVGISIEAYRYPTLHCDNLSTKRGHGAVGSAFEWHSKGQGSNPLGSTKKISYKIYDIFFMQRQGIFSVIYNGVALQHEPLRADAYAITEASKVHFLRIPLAPPIGTHPHQ